jgi:glycosyltransferase involved in cell wall biosynthesis
MTQMTNKKNILFVAMPDSVHSAGWIGQLSEEGWDIHLFPSLLAVPHPSLHHLTIHGLLQEKHLLAVAKSKNAVFKQLGRLFHWVLRRILARWLPSWRARQLAAVINRLKPDTIHTLEMQSAGYLALAAKQFVQGPFPTWIVTTWGSDIFFFGKQAQHREKIRQVLASCDYYACECQRDVQMAKDFGFKGVVLSPSPVTGGFELKKMETIRSQIITSSRKIIMLKGYQGWAGRALIGLKALAECADVLQGYTIVIYSAAKIVIKEAKLLSKKTGIATKIIPNGLSHDEILSIHAQARISIGLSISDGISVSLLEAMVMGSFPIQSCTACADEWIEHGVSGMIVPAEESEIIAMWIRKALSDDDLVNQAAQINWQTALARLDDAALKQQAIAIYNAVEQR